MYVVEHTSSCNNQEGKVMLTEDKEKGRIKGTYL